MSEKAPPAGLLDEVSKGKGLKKGALFFHFLRVKTWMSGLRGDAVVVVDAIEEERKQESR